MASWDGVWPPLANAGRYLIAAAANAGIPAQLTSGYRTHAQQRALYRRYLAGMNPYPVAVPGTSDHERGLAFDVWTGSDEQNRLLGRTWLSWGGYWSDRDRVHFTVR
jgi:LAS superfamily LD-carboxypeptidase LdcB